MGSRESGFKSLKELAKTLLVSPLEEYANGHSLLTFLCLDCYVPIKTTGWLYKKSEDAKRCIECKKRLKINNSDARSVFIEQCKQIHGGYYDYSKLPEAFSATEKITIICPKHGEIETTADTHKNKSAGCKHCHIDNITTASRSTLTEFILKANNVHDFKYGYSKSNYVNAKTPITITCSKHGDFEQSPDSHLRGAGCNICTTTSKPVKEILKALDNLNVSYSTEKMFDDCVSVGGRKLRFDIFIPHKNILVEYDGIHHFQPTKYSSSLTDEQAESKFQIQQQNDEIKNKYCEDNNIDLVRIPYIDLHPGATVTSYVMQLENKRLIYTWLDFNKDTQRIISYIKTFNYQHFAIYGVTRGGIPLAVHISNHFENIAEFGVVGFQRYDGNDKNVSHQISHQTRDIPIFVIDDLISSGITMNKVIKSLQHKYKKAQIHPIVVFGEENKDNIFFVREHPKQWIVFPYEI